MDTGSEQTLYNFVSNIHLKKYMNENRKIKNLIGHKLLGSKRYGRIKLRNALADKII